MKFTANQIATATGGRLVRSGAQGELCTDSRNLREGTWFVALQGERFDGHAFLAQAQAEGAAGCVVSKEPGPEWTAGVVVVGDTTKALQDLGRSARARFQGPVVGISGCAGKTTTRTLVSLALGGLGKVHQTEANLNNVLGVPITLVSTPEDAAAIVVELGSSRPGEIAMLCEIARPNVRLVVNIGPAHLEEIGDIAGVAKEEGAQFDDVPAGEVVIVNEDDPWLSPRTFAPAVRKIGFGCGEKASVRLVDTALDPEKLWTRATWETPQGRLTAPISAPGDHIAHDAAAALAVAFACGLDLARAAASFSRYEPVGMRMKVVHLPNGVLALNDAYNANPTSMTASLKVLASLPGRRIAVLGDMLELGADEERFHDELVVEADRLGLDLMVLVGPRMSAAARHALATPTWAHADPQAAIAPLQDAVRPGDRILFKGSRGTRVERVLQALQGGGPAAGGH